MAYVVKGIYFMIIVVLVGWYSIMLMRGLNVQLSQHFMSNIETEMEDNPHMQRDYAKFKDKLKQEEEKEKPQNEEKAQEKQLEMLKGEARKIQAKLAEFTMKSGTYVDIGVNEKDYNNEQPNYSRDDSKGHREF